MNAKTGRNERCPCGSGRKYKQCCLRPMPEPATIPIDRFNRGAALQAVGRLGEAARCYREALALQPTFVEAHINLGNTLQGLGEPEQALACYRRAQELRPDLLELQLNIGAILQEIGRLDEAAAAYRRALAVRADDPRLHNNLGLALRSCGRLAESEEHFRRAIAIAPQDADLHHSLADVLMDRGNWEGAMASYRHAIELDPPSPKLASGLLMTRLYADSAAPADIEREHRRYAQRFAPPAAATGPRHPNDPDPARRLKIAYVSSDFRAHSVAYFIEPVIAAHDRQGFAIHCYDSGIQEDAVTHRLKASADVWVAAAGLDDDQLARRIRADGIDILVDLSGHSAGNRLLVFARRPAPVQVSWLGYPHPTGLQQIDYFLTDPLASPSGADGDGQSGVTAQTWLRLPRVFSCYRPPDPSPEPEPAAPAREGVVTLGCFNNAAKISTRVLALWSRLLRARPYFQLLLKDKRFDNPEFQTATIARFAAHGIEASRLRLLGRTASDADHLRQYGQVDIALDTYPYCGVTTTCEALWMGTPVVSLAGDSFVSRMGLTLLSAVGHPEWVALDEDGYIAAALALAEDPAERARLRRELRGRMRASALMDERGFTAELEQAYRRMWQDWCRGTAEPASRAQATA
jgi:predicted O-linked N-acetylglucosamine transferase (SPINDLY family)